MTVSEWHCALNIQGAPLNNTYNKAPCPEQWRSLSTDDLRNIPDLFSAFVSGRDWTLRRSVTSATEEWLCALSRRLELVPCTLFVLFCEVLHLDCTPFWLLSSVSGWYERTLFPVPDDDVALACPFGCGLSVRLEYPDVLTALGYFIAVSGRGVSSDTGERRSPCSLWLPYN